MTECRAIRFVPVPQQIARRSIPWKGLGHLAGKPVLRGIFSDVEVNNFSAVMTEDDEGIEKPKSRGYNNEHVDGGQAMHVVVQK